MPHARAEIGIAHYAVTIDASGHRIVSDEPMVRGGANAGPAPYDLLLAGLGACTAITLRMYADRKQWDVKSIGVDLQYLREGESERIHRKLDRKSTRLNSSHRCISYAVFCLKKKRRGRRRPDRSGTRSRARLDSPLRRARRGWRPAHPAPASDRPAP